VSILQWIIGGSGLSLLLILTTLWKIRKWLWNQLPSVQQLKKDRAKYSQLCMAESDHLAHLKALIDELEERCVQETLACLQDMRTMPDFATQDMLYLLHQRLFRVIEHINNEAAVAQTTHTRAIKRLTQGDE